ncbi:hypothetical protein [Marinobacter adhaerens]|jgi:hypothetical protein|nr:hypothetical protein [Marinobacter adhaerens]MBW4979556.1 hypothetical protein [Marinobacter adhaerens]QWV14443.1 hypothetical protein KQ249_07580 [Marinobacter adhaerens]
MATLTIELPEKVTQGQMMEALASLGCELRLSSDGRNYKAVPREQGNVVRMPTRIREVRQPGPGVA